MVIAGFFGFADSAYITAIHYLGKTPYCAFLSGCNEVLSSSYAQVFGIPISLSGVGYYALILVLLSLYFNDPSRQLIKAIRFFAILSMGALAYFLYIQAVVLDAWCIYCLGSAASSAVIFIGSFKLKPQI